MSTSSSSSEEDLSLFQSVAVSAADIAESARKEAEKVEARRRSSNIGRILFHSSNTVQQQPLTGASPDAAAPSAAAAAAAEDGTPAPYRDVHGQDDKCELDITSKRIAAALDSILARELGDAAPPPTQQQSAPPAAAATAAASIPPPAAAAAADDDAGDTAGVRLFKRVAPGTPCVMLNTEYSSSASIYSLQPPGAPDGAAVASHLHPMFAGQARPFRSIREVIPRFGLAEASSSSNKKRHAEVLDTLAVDGSEVLAAAAAAAGSAWQQLQQLQEQQQQQSEGSKKKKKRKSGLATHAALTAWKHMRKYKVDGVVIESKRFVPHDVRMAALLGRGNAATAASS